MANTKITSRVLADNAVLTANITDANVTTAKVADNAVTGDKVADDVALAGNPTTTTQSAGNNTTRIATTAFVSTAVANLADSAPDALNTLNELAAAMGDDANFSTTITNSIAAKLPLAGGTMTGNLAMGSNNITSSGTITGTLATAAQTNITSLGTLTSLTVDEITINADTITATDDFILDVEGEIVLDANNGGQVQLKDNGTEYGRFFQDSNRLFIQSMVGDADILIRGVDGSSTFTALQFDMSDAGKAVFNSGAEFHGLVDNQISHSSTDVTAANSNSTLRLGNSAAGNGIYNAIKFAANQQDMYIMSFNNSAQADRRMGFFLGSVAGDAVADERLSIRGNGSVGIGTTSPDSLLHVDGSFSGTAVTIHNTAGSTSNDRGLDVETSTTGTTVQRWFNAGTELMRVQGNGNVGINTTNSGDKLSVCGTVRFNTTPTDGEEARHYFTVGGAADAASYTMYDGGQNAKVFFTGNGASYFTGGNLGVGDDSPAYRLELPNTASTAGQIRAQGYASYSDSRIKSNIQTLSYGLDIVKQLKPSKYKHHNSIKEDGQFIKQEEGVNEIGVIAQEVLPLMPEVVCIPEDTDKDLYSINYPKLTAVLTKAIQELTTKLEAAEARIKTLEDA